MRGAQFSVNVASNRCDRTVDVRAGRVIISNVIFMQIFFMFIEVRNENLKQCVLSK